MKFSPLEKFLYVLLVITVIAGVATSRRLARVEREAVALALKADTLAASLDTSRTIVLSRTDSMKLLGDSLRGVERRIIQAPQTNDALDKALKIQRVALANLTATVAALREQITSSANVATDSSGMRTAQFSVVPDTSHPEKPPYTGSVDVSLPATGRGTLALNVSLPPAAIALHIGCGAPVDGIRPATAALTGPRWLTLEIGRVEQSEETCQSPALTTSKPSLVRRLIDRIGLDAGYGATASNGQVYVGPSILFGVKLWP